MATAEVEAKSDQEIIVALHRRMDTGIGTTSAMESSCPRTGLRSASCRGGQCNSSNAYSILTPSGASSLRSFRFVDKLNGVEPAKLSNGSVIAFGLDVIAYGSFPAGEREDQVATSHLCQDINTVVVVAWRPS